MDAFEVGDELDRRLTDALVLMSANGDRSLAAAASRVDPASRSRNVFGLSAVALAVAVLVAAVRVMLPVSAGLEHPTANGRSLSTQLKGAVVRLMVGSSAEYFIDAPLSERRVMVWQAVCPVTSILHDSLILFGFDPAGGADLFLEGVGDPSGLAQTDGTFVFSVEPLPRSGTPWRIVRDGRVVAEDWVAAFATRLEATPGAGVISSDCVLSKTDPNASPVK